MSLCIGIDWSGNQWSICLVENEYIVDSSQYLDAASALAYVEHLCALYPEPIIGVATHLKAGLIPLYAFQADSFLLEEKELATSSGTLQTTEMFAQTMSALGKMSMRSYQLPSMDALSSIPLYRQLVHPHFSSSRTLCSLTVLLQHMQRLDASWTEMNFMYLEVFSSSYTLTVVKEGIVIDNISFSLNDTGPQISIPGLEYYEPVGMETARLAAFWERLELDIAGWLALHHVEDIVIRNGELKSGRAEEVIDRLGEQYHLFLYPQEEAIPAEQLIAYGAALLSSGLHLPENQANVSRHLFGSLTVSKQFNHHSENRS